MVYIFLAFALTTAAVADVWQHVRLNKIHPMRFQYGSVVCSALTCIGIALLWG